MDPTHTQVTGTDWELKPVYFSPPPAQFTPSFITSICSQSVHKIYTWDMFDSCIRGRKRNILTRDKIILCLVQIIGSGIFILHFQDYFVMDATASPDIRLLSHQFSNA